MLCSALNGCIHTKIKSLNPDILTILIGSEGAQTMSDVNSVVSLTLFTCYVLTLLIKEILGIVIVVYRALF